MRERCHEQCLDQLRGAFDRVGPMLARDPLWRGRDRIQRDYHDPLGSQCERRLDRRVELGPAVEVPAPGCGWRVDVNRRKQPRYRCRRTHVLVADARVDIIDRPCVVGARRLATAMEGHAAARRC